MTSAESSSRVSRAIDADSVRDIGGVGDTDNIGDTRAAGNAGDANETTDAGAPRALPLWRRLLRHRLFMTGAVIVSLMLTLALLADFIQILPPEKMQTRLRFRTRTSTVLSCAFCEHWDRPSYPAPFFSILF